MVQYDPLLTNIWNLYDPLLIIWILIFFSQIQLLYMAMVTEIEWGVHFRQAVRYRHFPLYVLGYGESNYDIILYLKGQGHV